MLNKDHEIRVKAMRDEVSAIIREKKFPKTVSRNELNFHVVQRVKDKTDNPLNPIVGKNQSLNSLITEGARNLMFPEHGIVYIDDAPNKKHVGNRRFVRVDCNGVVA